MEAIGSLRSATLVVNCASGSFCTCTSMPILPSDSLMSAAIGSAYGAALTENEKLEQQISFAPRSNIENYYIDVNGLSFKVDAEHMFVVNDVTYSMNAGQTYYFLRDWSKVAHWMDIGRSLPLPPTLHFVRPLDYHFAWIIYYTNALYQLCAVDQAEAWTRHALEICPDDAQHLANLRLLTDRAASPAVATTWTAAPRARITLPFGVSWISGSKGSRCHRLSGSTGCTS